MAAASATMPNRANAGTAIRCSNRRRALQLNASVMRKSRDLFPDKTALHLADLTGYSVRSCEYWLSEKVAIPSDALAALLRSERGRDYLVSVMMDSTPRWWLQLKAWIAAIDYRAAEIKQRRILRKLLDDAHPATPSFFLQDEAFYEGQPAPSRSIPKR